MTTETFHEVTRKLCWTAGAVFLSILGFFPAGRAAAGVADTPLPSFSDGAQSVAVLSVSGVIKRGRLQTAVECTSLAAVPIDIGVEVFDPAGVLLNTIALGEGVVLNVAPRQTVTISTSGTVSLLESATLPITGVAQGSARVVATSPAVRCNVLVVDAGLTPPTGIASLGGAVSLAADRVLPGVALPVFADGKAAAYAAGVLGVIKRTPLQTEIFCTSLASMAIDVGVEIFDPAGTRLNNIGSGNGALLNIAPGATVSFGTTGSGSFLEDSIIAVSGVAQGLARVVSTSPSVLCSAFMIDGASLVPVAMSRLPMVSGLGGAPLPSQTPTPTPTWTPPPTSTPTLTPTLPGTVSVGGAVRYFSGNAAVAGVRVGLSGAGTATVVSGVGGSYAAAGLTAGNWTLRPELTGNLGNSVSALDAVYVLQAVVGKRNLDTRQAAICDVSGNGSVSPLDATRILQLVVGKINRFPVATNCGSDWAFFPVPAFAPNQFVTPLQVAAGTCQAGQVGYVPLSGAVTGQDFVAGVFGDCTGNWAAGAGAAAALRAASPLGASG